MQDIISWLSQPWPWYVAGPLIGLMVPLLLIFDGKAFGLSRSFRHICAAVIPGKQAYFQYNWREEGAWNLILVLGLVLGGWIASTLFANPNPIALSDAAKDLFASWGFTDLQGLAPDTLFSFSALSSWKGWLLLLGGGFLVGFGTRYADGCTSGHAITGLSNLQLPSLIAVIGFFVGGLLVSWFVLPIIFG